MRQTQLHPQSSPPSTGTRSSRSESEPPASTPPARSRMSSTALSRPSSSPTTKKSTTSLGVKLGFSPPSPPTDPYGSSISETKNIQQSSTNPLTRTLPCFDWRGTSRISGTWRPF
ncbi:hypothetical protein LINGRAHAP2_LOCUS2501 [Linum grandiflorum]